MCHRAFLHLNTIQAAAAALEKISFISLSKWSLDDDAVIRTECLDVPLLVILALLVILFVFEKCESTFLNFGDGKKKKL